jgi:SAM-dependent methyltransferase
MISTDVTRRDAMKVAAMFGAATAFTEIAGAAPTVASAPAAPRQPVAAPHWFHEPHDRAMIDWLAIPESARVLDAGCGTGNHVQLLAERVRRGQVTALDISDQAIAAIRARFVDSELAARVQPVAADVLAMPLERAVFDLAWSSHTMHILPDPVAGVRALARVCRPGGRVAVREDGFSSNLLPLDIGIGAPGLASRIKAAFINWFIADRLKRGRVPFGWARVLHEAGLREIQTFSFLFQLSPPFTESQAEYLRTSLRHGAELKDVERGDREVILRITDPASPDDALRRDDLHYTDVATVYVGVV